MGKPLFDVAISPLPTDTHVEFLSRPTRFSHSHVIKDWLVTEKWNAGGTWEAAEVGEVTCFLARRLNLPSLTERCRLHVIYVVRAIKN